jgi:hypothetical protein
MLARRRDAYRARSVRDSATALTATSMHSWSSGPRGSPAKGARFLRWSSMQDRPASSRHSQLTRAAISIVHGKTLRAHLLAFLPIINVAQDPSRIGATFVFLADGCRKITRPEIFLAVEQARHQRHADTHAPDLGVRGCALPVRKNRSLAENQSGSTRKFPVIGFVKDPAGVAALDLGKREGKELVYMGKVGTGWSRTVSSQIRKQLDTVVSPKSKLTKPIKKPKATWVEPTFVADIEYRDITS